MEDQKEAHNILKEYQEVGPIREVPHHGTRYLVPWFIIRKREPSGQEKTRLICDCRLINKFLHPTHFRLDNLSNIIPTLRVGMWAIKVDLKHAFFHLELGESLKKYIRLGVGDKVFEFQAACFGLSTLPQKFMVVMKVLLKRWRSQGFQVWVYLDDILLVSSSVPLLEKQRDILLADLENSGLVVNTQKSELLPTQVVRHLGFILNLRDGLVQVPSEKLKALSKDLGKICTNQAMSCRKVSAILGSLRSFLPAMPFLRAFSDMLVQFINQHTFFGWDKALPLPDTLKSQVRDLGKMLSDVRGRSLDKKCTVTKLHSDASDTGWGGIDLQKGTWVQEFWRKDQSLHINVKEIRAAISTVRSLAKPGDHVHLSVDNVVAYTYLKKGGGRKPHLNMLIRPFLEWALKNQVTMDVNLIRSQECLADPLSRFSQDKGDYTLDQNVFAQLLHIMAPHISPQVDMFASPGNHKLQKFVSRLPHWQSWGCNALEMELDQVGECYANPPWTVIGKWLDRLRLNPEVTCMMVLPRWVGVHWWPQLVKLLKPSCPVIHIAPRWGLFTNCFGQMMPPTKWPLLCVGLSGKHWREKKFRVKTSHFI
jgi:hypothetical protein